MLNVDKILNFGVEVGFLRYILSEGHLWSKRGHFSSKNGERAREEPLGGGFGGVGGGGRGLGMGF